MSQPVLHAPADFAAQSEASGVIDAVGARHPVASGEVRIVSLVPSLTELLFDLGLGEQVVGRTGFCIHPRDGVRHVPKLGGTKDVKLDALRALAPTHVIVNIDENRRETAEALATFVPHVVATHPCRPEDNLDLYALFGTLFGREAVAAGLQAALRDALAEADRVAATHAPETVLYLIWRQPWMTVARETYISAMLARVGWQTWPANAGQRYPELDWDALRASAVARVLLSSEPYRFRDRHLAEVEGLSARPAQLIDGEMASWYGSRAIAGLRYLASLRRDCAAGR